MFRIVLLLFAGIGAGYLLRNWSFVARLERGVSLTVWALLFVFGVTIGSNRELIAQFRTFRLAGRRDRLPWRRREFRGGIRRPALLFPERRVR